MSANEFMNWQCAGSEDETDREGGAGEAGKEVQAAPQAVPSRSTATQQDGKFCVLCQKKVQVLEG